MPRLAVRPQITLDTYKQLVVSAIRNGQSLETYVGGLLEALAADPIHDLTPAAIARPRNANAPLSRQSKTGRCGVLDAATVLHTSNA